MRTGRSERAGEGAAAPFQAIPESSGKEAWAWSLDNASRHGCSLLEKPKEKYRGEREGGCHASGAAHCSQQPPSLTVQVRFENITHKGSPGAPGTHLKPSDLQVTALILHFI